MGEEPVTSRRENLAWLQARVTSFLDDALHELRTEVDGQEAERLIRYIKYRLARDLAADGWLTEIAWTRPPFPEHDQGAEAQVAHA
jgi:hypothetical protein